jgi:predicted DNA-binding transcriptional regulator AlpA
METVNIDNLDNNTLLSINEIARPPTRRKRNLQLRALFPISRDTWYRGIKNGIYPKPIKLGGSINAWRVGDIKALIAKGTVLSSENDEGC